MSIHPKTLAERIALLMARSGIKSRDKLAERMGYSRTQLHAVETGKTPPTDRFLEKLLEMEGSAGLTSDPEHIEQSEPAGALEAASGPIATDAEILGLSALLNIRASQIAVGTHRGDLPHVREALEKALESRGRLPRVR